MVALRLASSLGRAAARFSSVVRFDRSCSPIAVLTAALVGCNPVMVIGRDHSDAAAADSAPFVPPPGVDAQVGAQDSGDAAARSDVDTGPAVIRGPLSGLPWPSGVHQGNQAPSYQAYGDFRGRPLDVAALYTDRESWAGLVEPGWQLSAMESFRGQLVLSIPLYPPALGNTQECATGAYDEQWKKLGTYLLGKNRGNTIIRLGWGQNDLEHEWHVDADPRNFITCFRKIVLAVRSTHPSAQFDFSFDPVPSTVPAGGDPYAAYPGDAYVDIVGMDLFDRFPATHTEAEWSAKCRGPLGLCTLIEFARAHKKRFSVGEWGVATCGEDPGGDNPFYIEKMVQTFRANADILAYESYFDYVGANVCSTLITPENAPKSTQTYRQLYKSP
jgi:hypothetical protein